MMKSASPAVAYLLGIAGAVVGGVAGFYAFKWILQQGFYAMILPPAAVGLGAGLLARRRMVPLGMVCAVAGMAVGLFVEWSFRPFAADPSLPYFITHLHQLSGLTLGMIAVGTYVSYRLAVGFDRGTTATE